MDIPPVIQAGDREDALARILEAKYPSGALLGADSSIRPPPPESLGRYRSLVNQIHPDRCADLRSEKAFQRASLAFDALCASDSSPQEQGSPQGWDQSSSQAGLVGASRWWETGGITDLDRCLEFRQAAMKSLWEQCKSFSSADLSRLLRLVADAERACQHLDMDRGARRSRLWPTAGSQALPKDLAADVKVAVEARRSVVRFLDLLCHLRVVHRFCRLLGRRFDHATELEACSPPSAAPELLRRLFTEDPAAAPAAAVAGMPQAPAAGPDDMDVDVDPDVDPLDAYMASLQMPGDASEQITGSPAAADLSGPQPSSSNGLQQATTPAALGLTSWTSAASGPTAAPDSTGPRLTMRPSASAKPAPSPDIRLATGTVVNLAGYSAVADSKKNPAAAAAGDGLVEQKGLQDKMLGDLESDESDLDDGGNNGGT